LQKEIFAEDSPKPVRGLLESSGKIESNLPVDPQNHRVRLSQTTAANRAFGFSYGKTRTNGSPVRELQTGLTKMKSHSARFSI
jgi:hypothetical protein